MFTVLCSVLTVPYTFLRQTVHLRRATVKEKTANKDEEVENTSTVNVWTCIGWMQQRSTDERNAADRQTSRKWFNALYSHHIWESQNDFWLHINQLSNTTRWLIIYTTYETHASSILKKKNNYGWMILCQLNVVCSPYCRCIGILPLKGFYLVRALAILNGKPKRRDKWTKFMRCWIATLCTSVLIAMR